jgi:hypothetical protein
VLSTQFEESVADIGPPERVDRAPAGDGQGEGDWIIDHGTGEEAAQEMQKHILGHVGGVDLMTAAKEAFNEPLNPTSNLAPFSRKLGSFFTHFAPLPTGADPCHSPGRGITPATS